MLIFFGNGVRLLPFLSPTTESQPKMKSGLPLNVVVRRCTPILQLLASQDQSLLIRKNSFLILAFTFSVASEGSTSRAMAFSVRVFMKICILAAIPNQMTNQKAQIVHF